MTLVGSVTGLPSAGHDKQYVPSCVPIQINFRSNSTKMFSVEPRHQVSYLLMSPPCGGTNHASSLGAAGFEMSNTRTPALNHETTMIAGFDAPARASIACCVSRSVREPYRNRCRVRREA